MEKFKQTRKLAFLIILTVATFSFLACSKSDESDEMDEQFNIDAKLEFSVFNTQIEDLLNPENPNHLNTSNIKILYVINDEIQEVYDPNTDNPRNFMLYKHESEYRIKIFLNHSETADKPITYIQWNDSDTDTIEVSYQRTQNAILQNIIWLNGEQIWERGNNTVDPYFVLTK